MVNKVIWNPPTVHMKKGKDSEYTLCGRKIYTIQKTAVRLLCVANMGIKGADVCKSCSKIYKKRYSIGD